MSDKEEVEDSEEMEKSEATEFRGMVARLNYLTQDAPDLQYPSKEVSREMARPKKGAWAKLKKIVRYMLGRKAVLWQYHWQDEVECLETGKAAVSAHCAPVTNQRGVNPPRP